MRFFATIIILSVLMTGVVVAQPSVEIGLGETVEGLLSTGETAVEYRFSGERGQFITITLIADPASGIDSYLQLVDADGTVLIEDDDSAGSLNSRIGPYRIPDNGDYIIVATSLGRSDVGRFSLTVESVQFQEIAYGQRLTGELTATQPTVDVTFTAEAGDTVTVELNSDDFDAYLTLFAASPRTELISDDDSGGSLNSRIGPYVLTEAGDYQIQVSSLFDNEPGEFDLTLNRIVTSPINFGEPFSGSMSASSPLIFAFEGQADQVVDIVVDTKNILDTKLQLLGPNSRTIAENDDTNRGIDPALQMTMLDEFGTHFIFVEPYAGRDFATPVTVTLTETQLPSLDAGPQVLNLSDLDTRGLLTFDGQAGEIVTVRIILAAEVHLSPDITVRQGGTQIASVTSFTINNELSFGLDIPGDGPVIIELRDYDYVDADITIELAR